MKDALEEAKDEETENEDENEGSSGKGKGKGGPTADIIDDKNKKKELESTAEEVKDTLKTAKDVDSKESPPKKEVESAVKDMKDALEEAKDEETENEDENEGRRRNGKADPTADII